MRGPVSSLFFIRQKIITINNATSKNSGLYFCIAAGKEFTFKIPTMLLVQDVIPAFDNSSYVTFPPLTQATMSLNIEITFKPKHNEGKFGLLFERICKQIL